MYPGVSISMILDLCCNIVLELCGALDETTSRCRKRRECTYGNIEEKNWSSAGFLESVAPHQVLLFYSSLTGNTLLNFLKMLTKLSSPTGSEMGEEDVEF